jgi:hypothetical protein
VNSGTVTGRGGGGDGSVEATEPGGCGCGGGFRGMNFVDRRRKKIGRVGIKQPGMEASSIRGDPIRVGSSRVESSRVYSGAESRRGKEREGMGWYSVYRWATDTGKVHGTSAAPGILDSRLSTLTAAFVP